MIRRLALAAAALLVGGCISTSEPVTVQHYTLAPAKASQSTRAAHAPQHSEAVLRLGKIQAPGWLNSTHLYYQLNYRNGAEIAAYSRSDWVAPPPVLLRHLLVNVLHGSGDWQAIVGPNDVAQADMALRIQLNDLQQAFSSRDASKGVLDATATLFATQDNQILAQRHFHIEKPAPSADAEGAISALGQASQAFATQVRQWLAKIASKANSGT